MNQAPTPVDESQKPATSRWRSPVLSRLRALAARHPWVNVYLAVCLVCLPVGPLPVAHGSPEEEEWTMDHSESVVEVSLLASAASVYSGETVGLSVTVQRHSWEVWVSDWGNVETREDSYEAIPEADLSWSLSSGTGTLEGASETDGQGAASGTFVLNSSSDVRVAVLDNGVETGSAEIHIEETTVEETWGLSQSVSELEVVFQPVEGGPLLAQGAVRTLSAEARWHGYEVWTSNLGNSENRSESYTAAEGATVTFTVLSGEQSSLDGQTTRSYTADSSGVVSTSFTMGTVEATVGVTATQGPTEVTGSPLTLTYSPPVEEWSFDRHETVHTLALSAEGGVTQAAQETQIPLTAHAVQIVRDVWVSNLGNTRYENVVTTDAGGLLVSFHVNQVLEGSFQPNSVFTGTDGLAPTVFFMGGVDAHLSARARDANGTELCSVSMEIGSTAEEIWTKLRDETTLAVSIDPGGSTVDVPRNTQYTATVSVNHESWEVWRSNRGGMDIRNLTSGAASGAAVSFSSESSPIYTNSSGTASTTVTIGAQSVLLVADVAFRTATGVASVDYSPADAWVLQGSDELLTVDSSLSNGLSVMVSHSTWDVFRNIDDNTTEIRNRVTLPAGGAQVSMSMSNGTFSGDQSWTTSFADNNGVASASYTRTSIYSDTEFNVSASYMGLTASAPPLTVPGLPSPPPVDPDPTQGAGGVAGTGPTIAPIPPITVEVGSSATGSIQVSGGTPPYSYSGPGPDVSTTGNFVTDRYDNPGLYTFSIGATDSTGRAASGVTVGVFVVERIQQQTGSSPGSNSPLQLPQNGWVDNEVVKVCVFANTAVKPKVKLGWQEFRVYRPPPNSHKYDITKFRRLYWRLYPGSSFTIAGGSGKIWLGPYAFTQNDVYSQPSHIQAATTSDGSTWNWSAGTAPEITGIYWPSVDSMGWGRELEGDSVGMDYDEAVDGAPWKVKFTAPKTYEQELERRRDETFFPNFTTP